MVAIRACALPDVEALAEMNRMLIEDERAENRMNRAQLEARMRGFLEGAYRAYFFEAEGRFVGYALVNASAEPLYLRQFFICREERRKGYGKAAFFALLGELGVDAIDIEVYIWNETGRAFWRSLGFSERFIGMRFIAPSR